jgi:hypothetical protein
MNLLSKLLALQEIRKGKKYVRSGQTPPKGVTMHTGKRGGRYYLTEDKHMKLQGKHHELVRSVGVKRSQWDELREKLKQEGAESVEFINKPDNYKDTEGNPLYNIYVNWGEKTQQKIEDKLLRDKKKYGHRKESLDKIQAEIQKIKDLANQRKNEASEYWKQKHPDPEEYLQPDEKNTLEELEGKVPKEKIKLKASEGPPPDTWVEKDGIFTIPGTDRDGTLEGIYTVEPTGKYSAAISFTPVNGQKTRVTIKRERQNRLDVNISRAKCLVDRHRRYGYVSFLSELEREKTRGTGHSLREMLGLGPNETIRTNKIPWNNTHNLSFTNADEARAWTSNNIRTVITGLEDNANMGHLAHLLSWTKSFEDAYHMAVPGRIHLGVHANWGDRPVGLYYYASNSMHFQQDRDIPYDMAAEFETENYLERKKQKGDYSDTPWSASEHGDAVYWHEFGHLLDHLTKNGLSRTIATLSPDEKKQLHNLSDYPASKNNILSQHAEYVAESVSALMTDSPRVEYIPDTLKDAIKKAFTDMPNLAIDYTVQDPVNIKDWSDAEGEFYNLVKLPEHPKDMDDDTIREYYSGMSSDDIFTVLRRAKSALEDKKLNPDEKTKESTREERYAIRQNIERVAKIVQELHAKEISGDPGYQPIIGEKACNAFYNREDGTWTRTEDGYERAPYYQHDDIGIPYGGDPVKREYKRNGFVEIRPAGAIGVALYHVDDEGNSTLLVDHKAGAGRLGVVNVEEQRKRYADNIKWQMLRICSKKHYQAWTKQFQEKEEKRKQRQQEYAEKRKNTQRKPVDTGEKKPMHKDTIQFLSHAINVTITTRPSEMTDEQKKNLVNKASDGWMKVGALSGPLMFKIFELREAIKKPAETRSEKNLQKKYRDQLDEGEVLLPLAIEAEKKYIQGLKEKYHTENLVLATYMNNNRRISELYDKEHTGDILPSKLTPEQLDSTIRGENRIHNYQHQKKIEESLIKSLESAKTPEEQRDIAETLKEHKIVLNAIRDQVTQRVLIDREELSAKRPPIAPPKIIADVLGSDQYPLQMTPNELDAWTVKISTMSKDELKEMKHQLDLYRTAGLLDDAWRKEQNVTKYHWENEHNPHINSTISRFINPLEKES